jgi:hypothetical protein
LGTADGRVFALHRPPFLLDGNWIPPSMAPRERHRPLPTHGKNNMSTNVLTRQKEIFQPLHPGKVNIYVCGPTVYDYSHIGHAKTYIAFDVIVRYLRYSGYDVLYVQNITDVGHMVGDVDDGEDKILKKARQDSTTPMQLVETYTRLYFDNMDALGVQRPDISPRASGHIPEQISMIETLIAKGHAYEVNGSVYFDVTSDPDYGKLSGRRLEEQEEGTRFEVHQDKRHPADFALWKRADPEHLLKWPSPWGWASPVGTSNARPWRRSIWGRRSIFMGAAGITSSPIMSAKSPRANARTMPRLPIIGC